MNISKLAIVVLLIVLTTSILYARQKANDPISIDNKVLNNRIDTLTLSIQSQVMQLQQEIKELKNAQLEKDLETAKQHIDRANRIIDWSAMMFTLLAVLLVVAGGIGLREFAKIRDTEKNMNQILNEIKNELNAIQSYRESIINEMQSFMDLNYYFNQGLFEYNLGEYLKARELLYKVIEIKPDHLTAYSIIGKSIMLEGSLDDSVKIFNKMLSIDPNNSEAYRCLALAYLYNDETHKAIAHGKKSIELDPNNINALNILATAYREIDNLDEAFKHYLKSSSIKKFFRTSFYIGLIYYAKNDYLSAQKYFEEAKYLSREQIEKAQKLPWAYYIIAVIEGLYEGEHKAKVILDQAIKIKRTERIDDWMRKNLNFLVKHSDKKDKCELLLKLFSNKAMD